MSENLINKKYQELIENEIKLISEDFSKKKLKDIIIQIVDDLNKINQIIHIEFSKCKEKQILFKYNEKMNNNINLIYSHFQDKANIMITNNLLQVRKLFYFMLIDSSNINYQISEIIFNAILLSLTKDTEHQKFYYIKKNIINYKIINFDEFNKNFDTYFQKKEINNIYECYELNIHNKISDNNIMNKFLNSIK